MPSPSSSFPHAAKHATRLERQPNDLSKLTRFLDRTARDGERRVCYEASGAGSVLHRALRDWGYRCRETCQREMLESRHYILKFLARRGFVYRAGTNWCTPHLRWLEHLTPEFSCKRIRWKRPASPRANRSPLVSSSECQLALKRTRSIMT